MDTLAAWLSTVSWPIVSRVLTSLGFGYLTYTGADSALGAALDAAKGAVSGLGPTIANLFAMSGFFDYMAITSGGIVSGLAWMTMKHMALRTS